MKAKIKLKKNLNVGMIFCAAHSGDGYASSPERVAPRPYEDPYYTQFLGPAAGRPPVAPVIDEETK